MKSFFEGFVHEDAEIIESYSRLIYELRENRTQLLQLCGADSDQEILDSLVSGQAAEHPTYEHYLSARILAETRETIRTELNKLLQEAKLT